MKRTLILIGISLIIAFGCSPKGYWYKPGATKQQFDRDLYECKYRAEMLGLGYTSDSSKGTSSLSSSLGSAVGEGIGAGLIALDHAKE